jgi:hypothetical protein
VKYVRPDDRAVAANTKWVPAGEWGSYELKIKGERGHRLTPKLLRDYMNADGVKKGQAFSEIVEFEGMTFDEVKVEVELENGTRRTFNLEKPSSGHPMTIDLENLKLDKDQEPTEASVFVALRAALDEVA